VLIAAEINNLLALILINISPYIFMENLIIRIYI